MSQSLKITLLSLGLCCLILTPVNSPAQAAGCPSQVSLTFDDGLSSVYSLAAPLLAEYGFVGTAYVYPQAQNEKEPGYYEQNMSWTEVLALQNNFGWEIGSHGYSHTDLTTVDQATADNELLRSKNDLLAHGLKVQSFSSPYGAYNNTLINAITGLYSSHRTAWNEANEQPANAYYLKAISAADLSLPQIKSLIDSAATNGQWLILYFHGLATAPDQANNYFYSLADLRQLLDYLKNKNLSVTTVSAGLTATCAPTTTGPNKIINGGFEQNSRFDPSLLTWYSPLADQESITNPPWGNAGTLIGDFQFVPGRDSTALSFTDLSWSPDYLALPARQVINPNAGAISFWYQPQYNHTAKIEARFFEADDSVSGSEFEFSHKPDGSLYFKISGVKNNALTVPATNYTWQAGAWLKLEARWQVGQYLALYLNDQKIGLLGRDDNGRQIGRLPDFTGLYLGQTLYLGSGGSRGKINGALADLMIFKSPNYQLSTTGDHADFWLNRPTTNVTFVSTAGQRQASLLGSPTKNTLSTFGLPVTAGTRYQLSADFILSGYQTGDASVWVAEFDSHYQYLGGTWLGGFNYDFSGRRSFSYLPPANTSRVEIYFLTHENSQLTMLIDNVELKKINP